MPRPKKTQNQDADKDLTSKSTRRKRTPSAEMAGMKDSDTPRSTGAKRGRKPKSESERNNEYENPQKREGYDQKLRDDYYQEGARYGTSREGRGMTEFNYDRERMGPRDPQWSAPQEYGRQSYNDPGIDSDYRNRRGGGSGEYRSEYMSGRGDVPSGGYYGYERMSGRSHGEYGDADIRRTGRPGNTGSTGRSSREESNERGYGAYGDDYYGQAGTWHHEASRRRDRDYEQYDSDRYRDMRSHGYNDDYSREGRPNDIGSYDSYRQQQNERGGSYMSDRGRGNEQDRREHENRYRTGYSGRDRESWQDWNDEERRMMDRRRGGYPKNTGY
jgi:hypothetical protein